MKKLLVYLHGFGFDKTNNNDFVQLLGQKYKAQILSLDAPFDSERDRGGFAWFRIQKNPNKHIYDEKLDFSVEYILQKINSKLKEMNLEWKDVVLAGRSQGAFVALYMVLSGKAYPSQVISLCGSYPTEILERGIINKNTPILWVEAKQDTVKTQDKKDTYKNLIANGCNVKYVVDNLSDHDNLNESIIGLID